MKQPTFNIYVMSYKRSDAIMTQKFFEYCTYVVRADEAELYKANGVKNILAIPDGEVHDFMSTLYWIINNTPEDVIYICDDDVVKFAYRMNDTRMIEIHDGEPDVTTITAEVERIGQLIYDLDIGYAFDQSSIAPYSYTREFSFIGMPGHMRWINKKALKATYDSKDDAASDIDMMMQELMFNRICLQPKYFVCRAFMDTNVRVGEDDRQTHIAFVESMKNKWGRYYEYDFKRNIARIKVDRQHG